MECKANWEFGKKMVQNEASVLGIKRSAVEKTK
jgi:hypothetical protein